MPSLAVVPELTALPEVTDLPDGLRARPLRLDDLDAVADLLATAEPQDDTGELEDAEDLAEWFGNERVDLAQDTRVVETAAGELVAWASAIDLGTHREAYTVRIEGRVAIGARGRGIGRRLLDWQLARARELHRTRRPELPGRFRVSVPEAMPALARLVERAGLDPVRRHFQMARPLFGNLPAPSVDGVRIAPFDPARDEEVRLVHNRCFADHYGSSEHDQHVWRSFFTGSRAFRPELSWLASSDGVLLGYALLYEFEADTRATGVRDAYIGQVGVLREARGRGIASALFGAGLAAAAADGMDRASLQVDTENTTGALQLYQRLGFEVVRRETTWAQEPPPVG